MIELAVTNFICAKELAQQMGLCPRSVKRWWKRLGVPPTIQGHASHRWSPQDAQRLLTAWQAYWDRRNKKPSDYATA